MRILRISAVIGAQNTTNARKQRCLSGSPPAQEPEQLSGAVQFFVMWVRSSRYFHTNRMKISAAVIPARNAVLTIMPSQRTSDLSMILYLVKVGKSFYLKLCGVNPFACGKCKEPHLFTSSGSNGQKVQVCARLTEKGGQNGGEKWWLEKSSNQNSGLSEVAGGRGGIRTLVTLSRKHAFQACALNHSATLP